jgi:polyisoprenoid-binding protein YceI
VIALAGCGGGVPHATVAPIAAHANAPTATEPRARAEEIAPESTIEVVGTDSITGDHVVRVERFHGTVSLDEPLSCDFTAEMTSLRAESKLVEDFIKSPHFLDVRHYPEARFSATRIVRTKDNGEYLIEGRLSLHGIEKEISFPATLAKDRGDSRVRANFLLPRRAFNLLLTGIWEKLLEDDIRVKLDLIVRAPRQ